MNISEEDKYLPMVKEKFMENIDKGSVCPVCDKYARRYRRPMNSTMANSLGWLCCASARTTQDWYPDYGEFRPPPYVDVPNTAPTWLLRSNQLPTLRWWGLVERLPSEDSKKKHSGMWRATKTGWTFYRGFSTVPRYVVTYNGDCVGFEGDKIFISDLKGINFDYFKMMNHKKDE